MQKHRAKVNDLNMRDFLEFLWVYGWAIFVIAIFVADLIWQRRWINQYVKWGVVVLFSVFQITLWRWIEGFNSSFGGGSGVSWFEACFVALLFIWIFPKIVKFIWTKLRVPTID